MSERFNGFNGFISPILLLHHNGHVLESTVYSIPSINGSPEQRDRLLWILIHQLIKKKEIKIKPQISEHKSKRKTSNFSTRIEKTQKAYLDILGSDIRRIANWDFVGDMKGLGASSRNPERLGR